MVRNLLYPLPFPLYPYLLMRALALTLALLAAAASSQPSARQSPQASAQKPAQNPNRNAQQGVVFWNMSRDYVSLVLNHIPQPDTVRLAQIKQIFGDLECRAPNLRDQPAPRGKNLICTLPATAKASASGSDHRPGTILFLAHYEHEGAGQSALDNWSGTIMLPFLYHALAAAPRRHTFVFAEVDGASGAKALFDSLSPIQRREIKGVIQLDALGLGPIKFFISPIDEERYSAWHWLRPELLRASLDQQVPAPTSVDPYLWIKIDDTREFRHHNIPSILIHSVAWNMAGMPDSRRDIGSAINREAYFNTFTLLADYSVELDQPPTPATDETPAIPSKGRRR